MLSDEKDNIFSQYESSLRKNEQHIRSLYSDIFNLKIKNIFLENNIEVLLKKEKEYRLVKEKTGIYVENGAIVYNDRKENEIFILRKENSTLKNVITNTEKELNELKDKYKADKKMYETKISKLNHKLEQLKLKIKQNNHKVKNKSYSSLNTNSNNITTPNLKLNFSINNNSVSKGYNNSRPKTNRENNNINNSNIANNDVNKYNNKYNKYFESFILNPKEKKTNKNTITYERQNSSLNSCQSSAHFNLKNKILNKLRKIRQIETSKILENRLNLSNVNLSTIQNKKLLYLTPRNFNDNNLLNKQILSKMSEIKKKEKLVLNRNISKNITNNENINISNNNEVKIIYKKMLKNKSRKNNNVVNRQQRVKNELTWGQNPLINISGIPNSSFKTNLNNKNNNSNKILKDLNKSNISKKYIFNGLNNKRQRNINNNIEKNNSMVDKFSLTSIRKKNINKSTIYNCKNDLVSPHNNKLQ